MNIKNYVFLIVAILLLISCSSCGETTESLTHKATLTSLPSPTNTPTNLYGYIGLEYPPLPNSIKISTSWEILIWENPNKGWGISTVADGNNLLLWLTKSFYDKNGKPYSQVIDVAVLPPTARGQYIVVSDCLLASVLDSEIVALVKLDKESLARRYLYNPNIVMAWRAHQSAGKLEPMATTGIECYAETFLGYPKEP